VRATAPSRLGAAWLGFVLASHAIAGVPGVGVVVDAISDEFEAPWTFNYQTNLSSNGLWYGQFRGAPETLQLIAPPDGGTTESASVLRLRSVDVNDDPYPGMEDLVSNFYDSTLLGRFLEFSEEPSFVTFAYFPPVSQWPLTVDGAHCFGFRVAAWDHTLVSTSNPHGEYYPSIWAYRASDGQGYLLARVGDGYIGDVPIAQITTTGWFTLGLSWNAQGQIEYYAAAGRRALGTGDLIYTDTLSNRRLDQVTYHFFSLRFPATGSLSPDFLVDRCRAFTRRLPTIPALRSLTSTSGSFQMVIDGTTSGFTYRVERSATLAANSWQEIARFVSNGQSHPFADSPGGTKMFYRVARSAETLASAGAAPMQRTSSTAAKTRVVVRKQRTAFKIQPTWE
jgi:hypothetical protein